jgi:hypothetical protein
VAIDYIINRECPAKETLGEEGIIHLVKSRTRGRAMVRMLLNEGHSQEEALSTTLQLQTVRSDSEPEIRETTVRQMLKESELLDDYTEHCRQCPVNMLESFGCFQSVNYPLTAKAEHWLASRAEAAGKAGLPDSILLDFIVDQNATGEYLARYRHDEDGRFFELRSPMEITYRKNLMNKVTVTTDQILDMFFAVGRMESIHQQFLLLFSGGLSYQTDPPDMERLGKDFQAGIVTDDEGRDRFMIYRMHNEPEDDDCIRQIKAFLRALFAAYCTGLAVTIDF